MVVFMVGVDAAAVAIAIEIAAEARPVLGGEHGVRR
jgi:hypothetical protein